MEVRNFIDIVRFCEFCFYWSCRLTAGMVQEYRFRFCDVFFQSIAMN